MESILGNFYRHLGDILLVTLIVESTSKKKIGTLKFGV